MKVVAARCLMCLSHSNEIQEVIQVYEAQYLFPKVQTTLLFMLKSVPGGEGEGGHLLVLAL